jgi:F-type H+-transporting ATPase subunit epsilon
MADSLKLSILTPEKEFFTGEVTELITESIQGTIGILADHMPLVTALKPCETEISNKDGKKRRAFTSMGILKVMNNDVKILCEACEWPEDIDAARAKAAKERAEKRLSQKDGIDVQRAEMALARALARLKLTQI